MLEKKNACLIISINHGRIKKNPRADAEKNPNTRALK